MTQTDFDIVYIKGNTSSGSISLHNQIDNTILKIINNYNYTIINSDQTNKNYINQIPISKVYIGFSRGSRYLKKLDKQSLKISIGGISGSGINSFIHTNDKILEGDMSDKSMNAHFCISQDDISEIQKLILNKLDMPKN